MMDDENRALAQRILNTFKKVAIVGISNSDDRPSHRVAKYLIEHGYDVVGVNPSLNEVLGRPCYKDLATVPKPLEVVDVFRSVEYIPMIVDAALKEGAKALWLQEGLTSPEAESKARSQGLLVVHDICMKRVHEAAIGASP